MLFQCLKIATFLFRKCSASNAQLFFLENPMGIYSWNKGISLFYKMTILGYHISSVLTFCFKKNWHLQYKTSASPYSFYVVIAFKK